MEIKLKNGVGDFLFGMTEVDLLKKLGKPNKKWINKDNENEIYYQYNKIRTRFSFYKNENGKLGHIRSSNRELLLFGKIIINNPFNMLKKDFLKYKITKWEKEEYDTFDYYFNEENWFSIHTEYDFISEIQLGVPFKNDNEYDWKIIS